MSVISSASSSPSVVIGSGSAEGLNPETAASLEGGAVPTPVASGFDPKSLGLKGARLAGTFAASEQSAAPAAPSLGLRWGDAVKGGATLRSSGVPGSYGSYGSAVGSLERGLERASLYSAGLDYKFGRGVQNGVAELQKRLSRVLGEDVSAFGPPGEASQALLSGLERYAAKAARGEASADASLDNFIKGSQEAVAPAPQNPRRGIAAAPSSVPPAARDVTATPGMPGSGNAKLAEALANANRSYASLIAQGAKVSVVDGNAGNGNQPVVVIVPPSLVQNPNQAFQTQVHYHGARSTAVTPAAGTELASKISAQMNGSPPKVFILPMAANMVPSNVGPMPVWTNVKDTRATANQALASVGLAAAGSGTLTVSAHSAGGLAIISASQRGGLTADKLQLEDCLYWADARSAAVNFAATHPNAAVSYVTSPNGYNNQSLNAADFPPGFAYSRKRVSSHDAAAISA